MDNYSDLPQPKNLKVPKKVFYKFYPQFNKVSEMLNDPEWAVYSQFYEFDKYELDIDIQETVEDTEKWGNEYFTDDKTPNPHFNAKKVESEIRKCAASFAYFCHKYVKILHPVEGTLPCVLYKYQKRVVQAYEDNRFTILSKFRQGGLTMTAVLWGLWRCMFKLDQQVLILSKTDREAMAAAEIARFALRNMPEWLKPAMHKDSEHEKHFADTSSILKFYTPEAARGKSLTILIVDEAAFIQNMTKYWGDMYPTIGTGGKAIVISTVNGMGNWYEVTYHKAVNKKNEFYVIDLDYWEHPEYVNPKWVRGTRRNLGEKLFAQEILRNFLDSGETYIPGRVINELAEHTRQMPLIRAAFANWSVVGEVVKDKEWDNGALWIWKEPKDGHEYIIGVDCAEGVGEDGDNSCFQILDMATLEQCAEFYSNIVPPNIFAQIIYEIGYYYNTALVVVESNGVGAAVSKTLQHDLAYENLYYEQKKSRANKVGVQVGPANRPIYLESLQHRLVNSTLKINSKRFVDELNTFVYNAQKRRPEAKKEKGCHDDAIMAMCICLYIRDTQVYDMPIGAEVPEEMMQLFKAEVFQEIKEEILRDSPEDWVVGDKEYNSIFLGDEDDMSDVIFDVRRRNEDLLREFGW